MLKKKLDVKLNLIDFLLILVTMYTIAPIVSRFISSTFTTYAYMLMLVFAFGLILLRNGNKSLNECMLLLIPFFCWKALQLLLTSDLILWGYGILLDCIFVVAGYYVVKYCKETKAGFWSILIIAICIITLATTIIGCIQYPEAARILASVDSNQDIAVKYDWLNIGGYNFVYIIVLLHPFLILAYKRGKLPLIWALLGSCCVLLLSVFSEYTTALLLTLITCILYFFRKEFKARGLFLLVLAVVLLVFLFSDYFSEFLNKLADVVGSESIEHRLRALAGGRVGIENSEDNRIELYENSLKTFFQNPIFGSSFNGGGGIGGHSFVLDFMAQYGCIGLFVIVQMYYTIYKSFFSVYRKEKEFGYILWILLQTLILSIINTGMWLSVLTLFAPIFLKSLYAKEEEE